MAGDVGFAEGLITTVSARERSRAAPGPVLHEYGPNVRIGPTASEEAEGDTRAAAPAPGALSGTEQLGLAAFALRRSTEYGEAKSARPWAGQSWGAADPEAPQAPSEPEHEHVDEDEGESEAPTPGTSDRLTGRVAVGVFLVSGTDAGVVLGQDEQVKIVAEIQNGLSWLGAQSPAMDVTWVHEIHPVTIDLPDTAQGTTYEALEAPWRDAALTQLGLGGGLTGVRAYVADLRTRLNASWAFAAFFTRYRVKHFAYASRPRLVMHYLNDGWGPDNIDRVFAHETGHIFGAPDEYGTSGCHCGGSHGFFGRPNGNCESCAPGGGVACIMRANTWAMCQLTPFHLGFTMPEEEARTS